MTGTDAVPVHRCAFHSGPAEAADITADLCRRAVAAGSPVVAHVDDALRRAVLERLPDVAGVTFAPHRDLVEQSLETLVDDWLRHAPSGASGAVTVVCQQAFVLAPDAGFWRLAEHAATAAVATHALSVTCLVDSDGSPERLALARETHPVLWCDGTDLPNPDLRPPVAPPPIDAVPVADVWLDPRAAAENRRWWHAELSAVGLDRTRREELVLVLHEAVGTAAGLDGGHAAVQVQITRDGAAVTCQVGTRTGCPPLEPHTVPTDRRLLMLWLAEKVSPTVSLAVCPSGTGSRIVVRAEDPDSA